MPLLSVRGCPCCPNGSRTSLRAQSQHQSSGTRLPPSCLSPRRSSDGDACEPSRAVGCDLYLHQQGVDTTTPAGRALFQMLGVFAEFERAIIQERVRAGIARARAEGKHLGRPYINGETSGRSGRRSPPARASAGWRGSAASAPAWCRGSRLSVGRAVISPRTPNRCRASTGLRVDRAPGCHPKNGFRSSGSHLGQP